jgi:hypothetical protein
MLYSSPVPAHSQSMLYSSPVPAHSQSMLYSSPVPAHSHCNGTANCTVGRHWEALLLLGAKCSEW